ncbi:YtxH domain-containing protein [Paenibacillus sp. sgz302251]|uniref:YtxH domain-containing protein n=1 Tax=Paenibacillus sp. sgz302251 TaxID=3414493 RepID=UPI003C7A4BCF
MSTRKQPKGFLLGAIAGGIVGSISALLLAPKAGKELRQDISAGAQKVSDTTVKVAGQVSGTTERFAKQIGGQAMQIADKTKLAVSGLRHRNIGSEETEALTDDTAISAAVGAEIGQASAIEAVETGETRAASSKELYTSN